MYEKVKKENPGFKATEVANLIAKRWESCDEETKNRFHEEYKKNKLIYDKEGLALKPTGETGEEEDEEIE
jgi:hypothetical protein